MIPTRDPVQHRQAKTAGGVSDYAALRDFVERATHGEINLQSSDTGSTDEPRLPSGWYAPTSEPPPRVWVLRPETRAAVFGLGAGLLVLVPLAVWSQLGERAPITEPASLSISFAPPEPARDTSIEVVNVRTAATSATVEPIIDAAQQLIKSGDVIAARTTLSTAAAARNPVALFVMAETYDPNMLAAWGARGVGADAERARALYAAAHALGHERAAGRLQSLK